MIGEDGINWIGKEKLAMKKSQTASPGEDPADKTGELLDLLIHLLRALKGIKNRWGRIQLLKLVLNTRVPTDGEIVVITFTPREETN